MIYTNRRQAAQLLYERLVDELDGILPGELVVLSIPRGGSVLGAVIAEKFGCQHDVVVCKKIVAPVQEELAVGAVCNSARSLVVNKPLLTSLKISEEMFEALKLEAIAKVTDYSLSYRGVRKPIEVSDKTVLLVDDGVATGETMLAAVAEVFGMKPHRVIVAVPVIAFESLATLEAAADAVVFLQAPSDFYAVGQWYQDFPQVDHKEVIQLLSNNL